MRGGLAGRAIAPTQGVSRLAGRVAARGARMLARPDLALILIAAVIFTHVWRLHDVVYAPALRPTLFLGLAVVAAGLRNSMPLIGQRLQSSVLALVALIVAVAAAGLPFALDTEGSTQYLMTWVLPTVLLAALVTVAVRSVVDVEWLLLALLAAAAIYLGILYARGGVNAVNDPAATIFYDRNELALMLVTLIPVALHFARPNAGGLRRAFAAACLVAFIFTIVRGGSRGGLIGLTAALGYVLITFRGIPRSVRVGVAAAAVVVLAGAGSAYWTRMGTMLQPTADYNLSNERHGRLSLWRRGVQYVADRPLAGVGVGGFRVAERELSLPVRRRIMAGRSIETLNAHNIFIQVAAELGLVGLALFVALLVQAARTLRRLRHRPGVDLHVSTIAHVLLGSLLGYVVCGVFLSAAYFPLLYVIVGLAAGLAAVAPAAPALLRSRRGGGPVSPVPSPTA